MKMTLLSALALVLLLGAAANGVAQNCPSFAGDWTVDGSVDATFKAQLSVLGITQTVWSQQQTISLASMQTITLAQTDCSFSFSVLTTGSDGSTLTENFTGSISNNFVRVSGSIPYVVQLPQIIGNLNFNGTLVASGPLVGGVIYLTNGSFSASTSADGFKIPISGRPNLTLTAQFPLPPTVEIATPAPRQHFTNEAVTLQGTAAANQGLQDVFYSLNNGPWTEPLSNDGWADWSADVMLTPGTNTVAAYALDANGNFSLTNTVTALCTIKSPLSVQVAGRGTFTPNYNGQLLQVTSAYTITAQPGAQFKFAGWSSNLGGWLTNGPTLRFVMQPNLVLTASFVDIAKPTLTITNPLPSLRFWSNATFSVRGRASDNVGVSNVWFNLNGTGWNLADGTSNWTANLLLTPGANTILACAQDAAGNASSTSRVSVVYVLSDRLQLSQTGQGKLSPNYSNAWLQLGNTYSVTATPAAGSVFSNWLGGAFAATSEFTNQPTLTFTMSSNLVLQANFVPNPFPRVAGTYQGLFFDTNHPAQENAGFFSATVSPGGSFSASLQQGARKTSFTGQFSVGGGWSARAVGTGSNALNAALQMDLGGGDVINGLFSNALVTAELTANRSVFSSTNPAPQAGRYTLVIPGNADAASLPGGNGFGTVIVTTNGTLTFAGRLGDGTNLTQGTFVSKQGQWPLYAPLYANNGSAFGWLTFANQADRDLDGFINWTKPPQPGAAFYPAGFVLAGANAPEAVGSRYAATNALRVLALTNGILILDNGNLPDGVTNSFTLGTNNLAAGANRLTLVITNGTGLFSGSLTNADTRRLIKFSGAVLQKQGNGFGQFPGTNQTGSLSIGPQ